MSLIPIFLLDSYKLGHVQQYSPDITQIWSNWTARYSLVKQQETVITFGLQYLIRKYLIEDFKTNFFGKTRRTVLREYRDLLRQHLGVENPKTDHIEWLHGLGYLPLDIYALPEGTSVPLGVPHLVVTNTHPQAFWLPNYIETLLSTILWKASTSATTAQRFRSLFVKYGCAAGETDLSYVNYQGHDFSMRGMSGIEDGVLSGMGHLLSFDGTDSIPALYAAREYYGAELGCGKSVPATEHSVMQAGNRDGELETFRRLLTEVYPNGTVSIVADTWDLWRVLTEYIPTLRETILGRKGTLVIRPDSGNPVHIVTGDDELQENPLSGWHGYNTTKHPAHYGTLKLLAEALGTSANPTGKLPVINNGAVIYGDGINMERAEAILDRMVNRLQLSPKNMVFGLGSFTYEYTTRDAYGFAVKATAVRRGEEVIPIWKDPITDKSGKKSHVGIPTVFRDENGVLYTRHNSPPDLLDACEFVKTLSDGVLIQEYNFGEIRNLVRAA